MHPQNYASLVTTLEKWLEEHKYDADRNAYLSPDIAEAMATASATVLDAVEASQSYAIRESLLEQT